MIGSERERRKKKEDKQQVADSITRSKENPILNEVCVNVKVRGYEEGFVKVLDQWIFYKSFGEPHRGTILCLHGGPGSAHDGGICMARLTEEGYRVVFYDQLGCGKSDQPLDQSLYTVERYVDEVEGVRQGLGLGKIHLYGHSWGGMLNLAYAIKHASNLNSLLVSSGTPSTPLCAAEMWRLRSELPKDLQATLATYERDGDYWNDDYLRAMEQVYKRHVCRLDPWPPSIRSLIDSKRMGSPGLIYKLMWGPNEFFPVGTLRYWDVTEQLDKISVPTLITCGRYDEVTPKNAEVLRRGIRDAKYMIFEKSSHSSRIEEPDRYMDVYGSFLKAVS
jgi:proline-specific peptidase